MIDPNNIKFIEIVSLGSIITFETLFALKLGALSRFRS